MLKITVKPLVGKASKHEFENVSDALVFLKSIEGNEQTRDAELQRAPVRTEQIVALCSCRFPMSTTSTQNLCGNCGKPRSKRSVLRLFAKGESCGILNAKK